MSKIPPALITNSTELNKNTIVQEGLKTKQKQSRQSSDPAVSNARKQAICQLSKADTSLLSNSSEGLKTNTKKQKYKRYPDQIESVDNAVIGFRDKKLRRATEIISCGMGKTVTGLWIKEDMGDPDLTLVALPSLALLKQTKDEWLEQRSKDFDYICVCSDPTVIDKPKKSDDDSGDLSPADIDTDQAKVTTDANVVQEFLYSKPGKPKVVFCTYDSLPTITLANPYHLWFDLGIADEAHYTAKKKLGATKYTYFHNDLHLPIKHRLYMTGTERTFEDEDDDICVVDMKDEKIFGPILQKITFGRAINDLKRLCDYEVIGVGISEEEIEAAKEKYSKIFKNCKLDEIIHNLALEKVMRDHKVNHALSFHSTVQGAIDFAERHAALYEDVYSDYLEGKHSAGYRKDVLAKYENTDKAVLASAKCLGVGVNLRKVDSIYFRDPERESIPIIQKVGRSLRQDENNPRKKSKIIVPLLHKRGDKLKDIVGQHPFKKLLTVLASLAEVDDSLLMDRTDLENYFPADNPLNQEPASNRGTRFGRYSDSSSKVDKAGIDRTRQNQTHLRPDPLSKIKIEGFAGEDLRALLFSEVLKRTRLKLNAISCKDFRTFLGIIRAKCPKRPERLTDYLRSIDEYKDRGLKEETGISFRMLKDLYADYLREKYLKSGRMSESQIEDFAKISEDIANLIWPKEIKIQTVFFWDEAVELIRKACPKKPGNNLIRNLKSIIKGWGDDRLKTFAVSNRIINWGDNNEVLANAIWDGYKAPKVYVTVDEFKKEMRRKYPDGAPDNFYDYLPELLKQMTFTYDQLKALLRKENGTRYSDYADLIRSLKYLIWDKV